MNITIAYTIGVYMVRTLLQDSDQSKIATLTGLLVRRYVLLWVSLKIATLDPSSWLLFSDEGIPVCLQSSFYSLGQLTTAFAWGTLSDMYGRKRFILMSNTVSTVSMLWFGLAPSYTSAAAARLVGGLFNCSFTCVQLLSYTKSPNASDGL